MSHKQLIISLRLIHKIDKYVRYVNFVNVVLFAKNSNEVRNLEMYCSCTNN